MATPSGCEKGNYYLRIRELSQDEGIGVKRAVTTGNFFCRIHSHHHQHQQPHERTMIKPTFRSSSARSFVVCRTANPGRSLCHCVTNQGGTVSFRLNEAADNVKIISSNGP